MNIVVRRANGQDCQALFELECVVFDSDRLSRRSFRRLLTSLSAEFVVAELGQSMVGYAVVLFRRNSAVARLYSIAVAPGMQGKKIGAQLLEQIEIISRSRQCKELRLEVRENNVVAKSMYQHIGFKPIGTRAHYYADGCDAILYMKSLDQVEA